MEHGVQRIEDGGRKTACSMEPRGGSWKLEAGSPKLVIIMNPPLVRDRSPRHAEAFSSARQCRSHRRAPAATLSRGKTSRTSLRCRTWHEVAFRRNPRLDR
jgi:hypothetical protein